MAGRKFTAQELRALIDYEPQTGQFTWRVNRRKKAMAGATAGFVNSRGYITIGVYGWPYPAHRLAWLHHYGKWPTLAIDHINGVKTDNRLCNLREATCSVNNQNIVAASSRSHSGFRGVSQSPNKHRRWEARIRLNGRTHFLGVFDTPEIAHAAYLKAKKRLHEGYVPHA